MHRGQSTPPHSSHVHVARASARAIGGRAEPQLFQHLVAQVTRRTSLNGTSRTARPPTAEHDLLEDLEKCDYMYNACMNAWKRGNVFALHVGVLKECRKIDPIDDEQREEIIKHLLGWYKEMRVKFKKMAPAMPRGSPSGSPRARGCAHLPHQDAGGTGLRSGGKTLAPKVCGETV